jgi:pyridoxine 5-phosphate synthase
MTRLSVNINKIATLRNARGGNVPDVIRAAADIERFGAQGITVHPRPDERHIRKSDVYSLKKIVTSEFLEMIREVRPAQATLVPDPPDVLTSNAGWNTKEHKTLLTEIIARLREYGVRSSLFIAPDEEMIGHAAETGTDRIELYTEKFASDFSRAENASQKEKAIESYVIAADHGRKLGLGINAGHDLNLDNLKFFKGHIPWLDEVSIGHALISDALYFGLEYTVQMYLRQLK